MRLKANFNSTSFIIGEQLTLQSTLNELISDIKQKFNISASTLLEIKAGFPPKVIKSENENVILKDVNIVNGDQLFISEKPISNAINYNNNEKNMSLINNENFTTNKTNSTNADDCVPLEEGFLVVREMEDDNSCLFRSIGYVIEKNFEKKNLTRLRNIISEEIKKDPIEFNELVLGQPILKYCDWIKKETSWGGAIELKIFSEYFQTEINSIDVQTLRVDKFGEGKFGQRVFILYSGIHYDAIAFTPLKNVSADFDQTSFATPNGKVTVDTVLQSARKLGEIWKKKKKVIISFL
ncbi:ubiquitin-specific protease otu1 [Clydaea vesicula]|uniref:Ubiquitin thioesterase OTU n=1 Tax=Clydaea vesicula TaxID=447962 RepID=A0AAD5TXC0_9FUNG|nr:ubiquitin-specific protease otu1 [Clydaea vesicula]